MSDIQLTRRERPIVGNVFAASPFGVKTLSDGTEFDFDSFHREVVVPIIEEAGLTAVRADSIYGPQSVIDAIWRGIQQAEIVLLDFTAKSANVAMEFAIATMIGKKMIYLTQDVNDIPTDVRGRLRYIQYTSHFTDINRMREELRQQLVAIRKESSVEMALVPMAAGGTDPVQARAVTVTREFVVVEALDGRRGVLGNADVEYSRIISDMTRRFTVGELLNGAFEVDTNAGMKYTLLPGTPNPWQSLKNGFSEGRTFTGVVQRFTEGLGAFVPVDHGINGLIHISTLGSRRPIVGDQVEVTVARMDADKRRISLHLVRTVARADHRAIPDQRVSEENDLVKGQRLEGEVVKAVPEGEGGYILLRLAQRQRPVMLHCSAMTDGLREDLNAGEVERGDIIDVEVMTVDTDRDRVTVRETLEEAEQPDAAELAQAG